MARGSRDELDRSILRRAGKQLTAGRDPETVVGGEDSDFLLHHGSDNEARVWMQSGHGS